MQAPNAVNFPPRLAGPAPDPDAAALHAARIAAGAPADAVFELAAIPAEGGRPEAKHVPADELPDAARRLVRNAATMGSGFNAYLAPAPRLPAAPPKGRASDEHVAQVRRLWLDFDREGTAEAGLSRLREIGLAPAFVITTGRAPWLRLHVYLELDDWLGAEHARRLMSALADRLSADKAPCAPSNLMRLAGSVAWPKAGKSGRIAELVTLEEFDR